MSDPVYPDFVAVRMKGGEDILANLTPGKADLWHGATGVSGEAGELLDCVKKHVVYGQPLNLENLIEELGDIEFYLQAIRNAVSIPRDYIIKKNVEKLKARYPVEYTDAAAKERKDKNV
jgi:NTP pyrophosphatase (non-canonical NTP hydrolase)